MILYFPRISKKNLKAKITEICINENINYNDEGIKELLFCSNFDIRQCINNLECILYTYGKLTDETVDNIIDIPKIHLLKEIIKECYNKNLSKVLQITKELYDSGYSANDIILTFMKYIENKDMENDFMIECENLETINLSGLSALESISDSFMNYCKSLETIDLTGLSKLVSVSSNFMINCDNLNQIKIKTDKESILLKNNPDLKSKLVIV
jgi:DNA polymerase III delta prime subunit